MPAYSRIESIGGISMRVLFVFLKNDSGATSIEYALIAAGIAMAIVAAVGSLGLALSAKFDSFKTAVQ
ncbi:MAG: Flp family type IVb pilin [Xanthobacteraceae bacterium]